MQCLDENTLMEFVDESLSSAKRNQIEAHLDVCARCRHLFCAWARTSIMSSSTVAPSTTPEPAPPGTMGRYTVHDRLGAGAMGTVFRGHDPLLDRTVALKLLRPALAGSAQARERLLREAQLMARVRHVNVVTVYDVGLASEQVYVAMELVEGQNLRAWLAAKARTSREIVERFAQAGAGLAAAHRAGVIHRDFKPANVLVDRAGHARVTDFGLARASASSSDEPRHTLVGTPVYMAPEQLDGEVADERSDQFSFCVSLFEALSHERPFAGSSPGELREQMRQSSASIPPVRGISRRAVRVLRRGLSERPTNRYPSMEALLADLKPRVRSWSWAAGAVALLACLGVAEDRLGPGAAVRRCTFAASTALDGTWDATRARALRSAFAASGLSVAEATATRVTAALDSYAARWRSTYSNACTATRARHEQSDAQLALRLTCLDERRQRVKSLADALTTAPDRTVMMRAKSAVDELPPIDTCAAVDELSATSATPPTPIQAAATALNARLVDVETLERLGQYRLGRTRAQQLSDEAHALGWAPLEAKARYWLGSLDERTNDLAAAERELQLAGSLAARTHDDPLLWRILERQIVVIGIDQERHTEAKAIASVAQLLIERAGNPDAERAKLHDLTGQMEWSASDMSVAEREEREALRLAELGPLRRSPADRR